MEVQTWPISNVTVRDRTRDDVGDLADLKASLTAVGQLQPIAADPDGTLLFGERRLRAALELGWTEIAVSVIANLSDLDRLVVERDENTCRKDMSWAERTALFDRIEAFRKRLTPQGTRTDLESVAENLGKVSPSSSKSRNPRSRDYAATGAHISTASAAKVREVRETAADPSEPDEVREEAQRQYDALKQPGAKVDPAHKAVKQAKAKAAREAKLKTGFGPGQWTEAPTTKPELTLTRRLTDGINRGQNLETLAAEITDQNLDLDIKTLYALRNRIRDEIKVRDAMKDALNQQIKRLGYDTRKVTVK